MANIDHKNGVYHARFRYGGKQYKKSLKTKDLKEARGALHLIEHTIHRLTTGQIQAPPQIDVGDFILSGGTLLKPRPRQGLSLNKLVETYLASQLGKADSTLYTEEIHLRHLCKSLGRRADQPCERITSRDLAWHLKEGSKKRAAETVRKERMSIIQLFAWEGRSRAFMSPGWQSSSSSPR